MSEIIHSIQPLGSLSATERPTFAHALLDAIHARGLSLIGPEARRVQGAPFDYIDYLARMSKKEKNSLQTLVLSASDGSYIGGLVIRPVEKYAKQSSQTIVKRNQLDVVGVSSVVEVIAGPSIEISHKEVALCIGEAAINGPVDLFEVQDVPRRNMFGSIIGLGGLTLSRATLIGDSSGELREYISHSAVAMKPEVYCGQFVPINVVDC
jgi:hypothetical protein